MYIHLASHMFLKLCPPGMVNFPRSLYVCPCPNPINLSYCLSHLLHQGVLLEVSEMAYGGISLCSILGPIGYVMLAGVG